MSIPTAQDAVLGEISDMASNIMNLLRTTQRAAAKDQPAMRVRLRVLLQQYVDAVMDAAPAGK